MPDYKKGVDSFDVPAGLIRKGTIVGYDSSTNMLQVRLIETTIPGGKTLPIPVPAYFAHSDSNGAFMGALPSKGTTVTLTQSAGGQYYIVNHQQENFSNLPDLEEGELLIQANNKLSYISLIDDGNLYIGTDDSYIHVFPGNQKYQKSNLITINFENENHFNQAYREVGGLVKRDLRPNPNAATANGNSKLEDDTYDVYYSIIGMDPSSTANDFINGATKNPPLVEHREIVYEFQYNSNVEDYTTESNKYSSTQQATTRYTTPNRRSSRADTMSLSLVAPNFLIEKIGGTVVDIFGNILDINRLPLPVGLSSNTTLRTNGTVATTNAQQSYANITALERKSVAYHFEINARKNPNPTNQGNNITINDDNYNAKLQRSRFFFDIDKEGQFKLNVPSSSEVGNISLLVRPENYSTFGKTDNGNPNQLWFTQSGQPVSQDVYVDSFAAPQTSPSSSSSGYNVTFPHGSIQLIDGTTNTDVGPVDRISQFVSNNPFNIRHGTVYHDILQTCSLHQNNQSIQSYQLGTSADAIDTTYIQNLTNIVSKTIKVSGNGANAGGRSGSINMDGSLEWNIGANTIDRQSLWLDTAGGMVWNIGRDLNSRSAVMNFDGDVVMQVGGFGIAASDARFPNTNGQYIATLDLRVFAGGAAHMFRIDSAGVTILSPQTINIQAAQGIKIISESDMVISAETLTLEIAGLKRPVYPSTDSI